MREHDARRFARAVREVVSGIRRARRRCVARRPARIRRELVLLRLRHHVRIAARDDRQIGPIGDGDMHIGGRLAEPFRHRDGLRRRHAGADFGGRVLQADLAVGAELDLRERRFRAGAEVLLHAREADAVTLARMRRFELGFALRAVQPQRMHTGFVQHIVDANRTGRHRALRVLHAGTQRVFQAELDRIESAARRSHRSSSRSRPCSAACRSRVRNPRRLRALQSPPPTDRSSGSSRSTARPLRRPSPPTARSCSVRRRSLPSPP